MERRYVSAMLSGLVFPGTGQIYNNQRLKGAVYIVLTLFSIIALVWAIIRALSRALDYAVAEGGGLWVALTTQLDASRVTITAWIAILVVSWAAGVVDAYMVARKTDGRDGKGTISRKGL